jgi:hypothetical protein
MSRTCSEASDSSVQWALRVSARLKSELEERSGWSGHFCVGAGAAILGAVDAATSYGGKETR